MSEENVLSGSESIDMVPVTPKATKKKAARRGRPPKSATNTPKPVATMPTLGVYKLHDDSPEIRYGTIGSACFDLCAYVPENTKVDGYTLTNRMVTRISKRLGVVTHPDGVRRENVVGIVMQPGDRLLVPSGYIFDIPDEYSLRTLPRSGLSLSRGLALFNKEGVIDFDYTRELLLSLENTSERRIVVEHGERVVQCEMVPKLKYEIKEVSKAPDVKTDRVGGLGSTGTK